MIAQASAPQNNLRVDPHQIARHLELLNYKLGETVFLRAFYPSDDPRQRDDKGRKAEATTVELIAQIAQRFQNEGRGIYLVVNGGGQRDAEVETCRAIFYEHDNLAKELQLGLWQTLGLPEPTFQVDTGGKSIHSYWVFNEPIDPSRWRSLQTDLLEFADADRSLKNPSRVMRLAGCYHLSTKGAYPTLIVSESGARYNYEELRAIVSPKQKTPSPSPSLPLSKNIDDVPLLECIPKADRELVRGGAGEGERNTLGYKLACSLIGAELRLPYLGIPYTGTARDLLNQYRFLCSPALDDSETEQIWKKALASKPTATLTDDAIINCVRAWRRKQIIPGTSIFNYQQKRVNANENRSVTGDSHFSGDTSNLDRTRFTTTVTTVTEILDLGFTDYEEQQLLEDVYVKSGLSKGAFWKLVSSQKNKIDTLQPEDEIKLNSLINWHNAKLDLKKALPSMASDLEHDAEILGVDPIVLWQPLLPAVMSLVGKKVKLDMQSHMIPAIAWTMTVMESGGGKTRADKVILTPIRKLQSRARKKFLAEMKEFENPSNKLEEGEERPTRPIEEKYLFEVATIQAVMRRASEQPSKRGQLWARDEIGGLFKSLGQFGSGENEGKECLLKMWDGDAVQVDRVHQEDSYFIDETAISVNGGIQPGYYRDIFNDPNDSQGLTARFLTANPKPLKPKRVKGYCHLSDKLPPLYDWLINLPETVIKPSLAADRYYDNLYDQIGGQAFETSQPAIRAWMYKLPANLLRIALALHFIECYHDPNRNFGELQKDTIERAVLFAQYYRSAFHIIQETTTDNDDISSVLLKIWDASATKHPNGITTRDAYRNIKAIQYRAKDMGRDVSAYTAELFGMLEAKGKGRVVKNGRTIKFIANIGGTDGDIPDPNIKPNISPESSQEEVPSIHSKSENPILGDRVTVAKSTTVHDLEVSPQNLVSPVTVLNHSQSTGQIETTQSYDEAPVFEEPEVENQGLVIPAQVSVPTQNEFASPSLNPLLIGKIIEALSGEPSELRELLVKADQEQREEALAQCTPEQATHLNNVAFDVDERNPGSLYPPGILIDPKIVADTAGYVREAIGCSDWDLIAELIAPWKPWKRKFEMAVWRELSPEDRKIVKQLKAEALFSESVTPPTDNLVPPASSPSSCSDVDAHQWKRHDRAIYCGQEVSLERVSPDDNLVTVRYQDDQREEVSKFLLEIVPE